MPPQGVGGMVPQCHWVSEEVDSQGLPDTTMDGQGCYNSEISLSSLFGLLGHDPGTPLYSPVSAKSRLSVQSLLGGCNFFCDPLGSREGERLITNCFRESSRLPPSLLWGTIMKQLLIAPGSDEV